MRPIDADALEARMYHDAFEVDSDMQRWDSGCWIRYKMFENAIREAPTIEERKTGKWIRGKCDQCGAHAPFWPMASTYYESDYCPNCGADMRGET